MFKTFTDCQVKTSLEGGDLKKRGHIRSHFLSLRQLNELFCQDKVYKPSVPLGTDQVITLGKM